MSTQTCIHQLNDKTYVYVEFSLNTLRNQIKIFESLKDKSEISRLTIRLIHSNQIVDLINFNQTVDSIKLSHKVDFDRKTNPIIPLLISIPSQCGEDLKEGEARGRNISSFKKFVIARAKKIVPLYNYLLIII